MPAITIDDPMPLLDQFDGPGRVLTCYADLTPADGFRPAWHAPFDAEADAARKELPEDDVPPGAAVAAMPIVGGYAEYLCLPAAALVPVPSGLDPAEAVCLILNLCDGLSDAPPLGPGQSGRNGTGPRRRRRRRHSPAPVGPAARRGSPRDRVRR